MYRVRERKGEWGEVKMGWGLDGDFGTMNTLSDHLFIYVFVLLLYTIIFDFRNLPKKHSFSLERSLCTKIKQEIIIDHMYTLSI